MQEKIIIVDSSSVVHRNYHGYPAKYSTVNESQININTLYGYINYIHKVSQEFEFDHLIHVLDPKEGSAYRKSIYPLYKANRPPTPEDLTIQKELLPTVLDAFSQRWVQIPGIESDDIISTLAHRHADRGDYVLVLTPDKDLLQLVEDGRICVAKYVDSPYAKRTGISQKVHDIYEEIGVYQKLGVHPHQVADFLALIGDVSDNIIGVKNIGDKKAAKLLAEYGDIESIITHSASIKGKIGEDIRNSLEIMPLMKKLTLTLRDATVPEISDILPVQNKILNYEVRNWLQAKPEWNDNLIYD